MTIVKASMQMYPPSKGLFQAPTSTLHHSLLQPLHSLLHIQQHPLLFFVFENRVRDSSQKVLRRPTQYTTSDPQPHVTGQEVGW